MVAFLGGGGLSGGDGNIGGYGGVCCADGDGDGSNGFYELLAKYKNPC